MFDIPEELKKLPDKPGVYLMKNQEDEIIYVGKAVNLKNRVRQYFQSAKNQTPKVRNMVPHIAEFEYIVTDTEMEALLLECNLIKKHRPKYNILLKDDKMYPYIKVTTNEAFPRVFSTRRLLRDKAKYYGPITDAMAVKETIELVHKLWPVRKCSRVLPRDIGKERPCLNYYIGQCKAPCNGLISQEEYQKIMEDVLRFLDGRHEDIVKSMRVQMQQAAQALDFEKAAALRDRIKSIESIIERQKMSNTGLGDCDVIAFARAFDEAVVQVFFLRGGKMTGREHFFLTAVEHLSRSEVITDFVKQFYTGTAYVPKEILLEEPLLAEEQSLIETLLADRRGSKVILTVPQKGEKRKLVELASKNASLTFSQFGEKLKREQERTIGAMEEIRQALNLPEPIGRIEAYDISNTQGFESVGAMVVFEDGKAKRSDYRKFRIKTVAGANDYASMVEVITRRVRHSLSEEKDAKEKDRFGRFPDLFMMDGGMIQVNAAKEVLAQYHLHIPVCGMVKDDRHRTRGIIFEDEEILLPNHSEGFRLLTRIQDEVHRFAIEYHRKLRDQKNIHSILDDIPGIGPVRRKALMRHFAGIEGMRNASLEELLQVDGMNKKAAESVYYFFRQEEGKEKNG